MTGHHFDSPIHLIAAMLWEFRYWLIVFAMIAVGISLLAIIDRIERGDF